MLDLAAGTFARTGTIQLVNASGTPKVINRAVLRVGNPTGTLVMISVDGVEFTDTSTLVMTLAADSASRLEVRNASPAAQLGGTLKIELAAGFQP